MTKMIHTCNSENPNERGKNAHHNSSDGASLQDKQRCRFVFLDVPCSNVQYIRLFNPRRKKRSVISLTCVAVYMGVCLWHHSA